LERAKVEGIRFHSRGASMDDIEAFCHKNKHLVEFDAVTEDLVGV